MPGEGGAVCGKTLGQAVYGLPESGQVVAVCRSCALRHRPFLRRAVFVAAAVGSCLVAINQGDVLLTAHSSPELFWKIPLTYAVPFAVSYYSSIAAARSLGASPRTPR
jgi:hypothetical protein